MTYSFSVPSELIRGQAMKGFVRTGLAQAGRLAVQFLSVGILSRILPPTEFGIVAMTTPIIAFVALFQDIGISQAVVQKAELSHAEVSTLFYFSLLASTIVAITMLALGPAVGLFYGEARAGTLTSAMSILSIIGGLGSIHAAILNRKMRFGALATIDIASIVIGLAVSVLFAVTFRNFWAIYAGNFATISTATIGFWFSSGWLPSYGRSPASIKEPLKFGANITGFNIANYFARNLDNILIGKLWGETALGGYDRAYKLLLLPIQQVNAPISKIMLPVLSRLRDNEAQYNLAFLQSISPILMLVLPGIAFGVVASDELVPLLLGPQWATSASIFTALGIGGLMQSLNNSAGWLFVSQNRTREFFYWGLFGSTTAVTSFIIGLPYGAFGVALAYSAGEYLRTPILWWLVCRKGPLRIRELLYYIAPHYCSVVACLLVASALKITLAWKGVSFIVTAFVATYISYYTCLLFFRVGRQTFRKSIQLFRQSIQEEQLK